MMTILYPQDCLEKLATGLLAGKKVVVAGSSRMVFDRIVDGCGGSGACDTDPKPATEDNTFAGSRA
jgi:hypothetical protein